MSFAELERRAWTSDSVAAAYAEGFPNVVRFTVGALLDAVGAGPGRRLIDLACGPGTVTAAALERRASVTAVDFSLAMLQRARRAHPALTRLVLARAERLPLRDGAFDSLTCNFGLLHFADPSRAIAEGARLLAPGGRLALTVWARDSVALRIVPDALAALQLSPELPAAPGFFAFAEDGAFEAALQGAGLTEATERTVRGTAELPSAEHFWRMFREGSARTRASLLALSEHDRSRVEREVRSRLDAYRRKDGFSVPVAAVLGSARARV
ncbi:MAG TPA: methyltransferase domain-containing protein [Thermoplasmata archaeon]|nr:methyltransferase domain-containing protein [Thermoplasmata archaeon]